jgi:hypothetical protein
MTSSKSCFLRLALVSYSKPSSNVRRVCRKYGKEMSASITRSELLLEIPESLNRPENKVEFEHVLSNRLKNYSIFEFEKPQCDGCNEVGEWVDGEGWSGKAGNRRMSLPSTSSPRSLGPTTRLSKLGARAVTAG